MKDVYSVKFYINDEEVEFEDLPPDYVNGLYKVCADKVNENLRWERAVRRLIDNMNKKRLSE